MILKRAVLAHCEISGFIKVHGSRRALEEINPPLQKSQKNGLFCLAIYNAPSLHTVETKAHKLLTHKLFLPPSGKNWVFPRDNLGVVPRATGASFYVYVPFLA